MPGQEREPCSLASERNRVAHPVLRLEKVALVVAAAGCHVAAVSDSAKDGHVALRPSIAIRSLLG